MVPILRTRFQYYGHGSNTKYMVPVLSTWFRNKDKVPVLKTRFQS